MTNILCIETSGLVCSVSISQNGECKVFKLVSDKEYRHAEVLHLLVQETLQESKLSINDLNAVAISKGPGSYTGLRVGVSAAKGFCYALEIPLIAINTLYLIALEAKNKKSLENISGYTAMIDARRDEVYLQEFDTNLISLDNPQPVILTNYQSKNQNIVYCGDGSEKAKKFIDESKNIFIPKANALANNMCLLSYKKFEKKEFEDVAYFEPFYLKEFYIKEKS